MRIDYAELRTLSAKPTEGMSPHSRPFYVQYFGWYFSVFPFAQFPKRLLVLKNIYSRRNA